MNSELNIECFDALLHYLCDVRLIREHDEPTFTQLTGGVSNRTVLVQLASGRSFVLKQALARLRVPTEWRSDPRRIEREALGLTWLERLAPPGRITPLLFLDPPHHLLAMEAVPQPHENWKASLLAGKLEPDSVRQFGELLAEIHCRSREHRELPSVFADRSFFDSLRLEPYYRYTAERVPQAAPFLLKLTAETQATQLALVHGDYSPKNVLIHRGQLVLLDHEVIHFGDPAFDLGFSLTHFLSKAHHLPLHRDAFFRAARQYWITYHERAEALGLGPAFESRVVRHTLACLLARVEGRSPLEYLTPDEKQQQRAAVLGLLPSRNDSVVEFIGAFAAALG